MRAAVHIGRVGGLAVALGVGCAIVAGAGVAAADETDTESKTRTSESNTSEPTKKSGSTKKSEPTKDTATRAADDDADDGENDADDATATEKEAKAEPTSRESDARKTERRTAEKQTEKAPEGDAPVDAQPEKAPAKAEKTIDVRAAVVTPPEAVEQVRTVTLETPAASAPLVTQVLSSVTLDAPQKPRLPVPQQSSLLMALLNLGTRRETEARTLTTGTSAPLAAAAVTAPVTTRVGWLTGAGSINDTVKRFAIAGTDVGVMWDNGITMDNPATTIVEQRQVLIAFGDTFSQPGMVGNWRNNVLLRSADNVLSNGLYVPGGIVHDPGAYSGSPMTNPNFSREIIGKYGYAVGPEVTIIPTAAIAVPGAGANGATRQYVNFMSVRSWDTPGRWTTNYSGVIWSDDNGQNWTVVPASGIRPAAAGRSTRPFINGNQNFQQGAYVKAPDESGWVYSYGTPAGRGGTVYVSRVNDKQILDQTKYEYWNGSSWVKNNPAAAKPILPGTTTSSFFGLIKNTTYPSAGEMSVQYNPYLKKYVMLYTDGGNNVVMRTSATPQGTWSAPATLATSAQYPGLYAPMIHPWSGSTLLKKADGTAEDPQVLYWNLSQWNEYNVALMRTDLSRV